MKKKVGGGTMEVSKVWQNKAFLDNGQVRLEYLLNGTT